MSRIIEISREAFDDLVLETRAITASLARIERTQAVILRALGAEMSELDDLKQADTDLAAAVAANTASTQTAVGAINDLLAKLKTPGIDSAAVEQAAKDIEAQVAAIAANTSALAAAAPPAAPPPADAGDATAAAGDGQAAAPPDAGQ